MLLLWFILRGDLFYVLPYVILFLCFSVLLALRLTRLVKRELVLVLFVRLFDFRLFGFVCFLFLLVSGEGCGLWLWHSLDFSLTLHPAIREADNSFGHIKCTLVLGKIRKTQRKRTSSAYECIIQKLINWSDTFYRGTIILFWSRICSYM